ncbi:MAG: pantetheine-phosphate adenylyltransferase, partial [Candidatus Marinimicrobia bacterium]|nr:pantetheine-phosphate adenylyltransferase [Candidatus Neomarinimicrobiota bacterium]
SNPIQRQLSETGFGRRQCILIHRVRRRRLIDRNHRRRATGSLGNVEVDHFSGLVVDYAREQGACGIIRGLRALSDFEVEYQMALMNRDMEPDITTVFLMPHDRYTYLNSSMIREVASYGRDVSGFVPPIVSEYLKRKYSGD